MKEGIDFLRSGPSSKKNLCQLTEGGTIPSLSFTEILKPQRCFNISRDYFKSNNIKTETSGIKYHYISLQFYFSVSVGQRYSARIHTPLKYIFVLVLPAVPVSN